MQTKTRSRLLVFLMTVFLLCCGLFCGNWFAQTQAKAEETPSITITQKNVSYSEQMLLMYKYEATGIDKQDVKMLFWNEAQTEYTKENSCYTANPVMYKDKNGNQFEVFYSYGIPAKNMVDYVYCQAYAEVNGETVYSEMMKYSVLDYACDLAAKDGASDDQKAMAEAMLAYGGAAQSLLGYKTDRLANATYYNVTVVGGTLADGFTTGKFNKNETIVLTAPEQEGKDVHWENSAGETVDTADLKVSKDETFTAVYTDKKQEFTVTFMADGVQYGEAQTVVDGETATAPVAPTKANYFFVAWYNGETAWNFADAVTSNLTLTARFEFCLATFVSDKNANDGHQDGANFTTAQTYENSGFTLTMENPAKASQKAQDSKGTPAWKLGTGSAVGSFSFTVPDDVTAVAFAVSGYKATDAVITINGVEYTVDALAATTDDYTAQNYDNDYTVIVVDASSEKTVSFATTSKGYRCMIASISYLGEEKEPCTVTFNNEGVETTETIEYGKKVAEPTVEKAGYRLDGWYNGETKWDFEKDNVVENVTLIARWVKVWTFTVNYGYDELVETYTVDDGATVDEIAPAREGYRFDRWNNNADDTDFDFTVAITSDVSITAEWVQQVTVTFDPDNGDESFVRTIDINTAISEPTEVFEKPGYNFDYWTLDGAEYDFSEPVVEDITLVATWSEDVEAVTFGVTFVNDDGAQIGDVVVVEQDGTVDEPATPVSTKEGDWRFIGWFAEGADTKFDFSTPIATDITLTATYEQWFTVTFIVDGETIATVEVKAGETIAEEDKPADPTKTGATFAGWTLNEEVYTFGAVTADLNIVAKFEELSFGELKATFKFGNDGGEYKETTASVNTYSEEAGDYTLNITSADKFYTNSYDPVGNGVVKLGSSSIAGTFTFTVPEDVTTVKLYVAGRQKKGGITVNGVSTDIETICGASGGNAEYTEIIVDTSVTKTITAKTYKPTNGDIRLILNTIEFYGKELVKHNVQFTVDGAVYEEVPVVEGKLVTAPTTAPTKDGYKFISWQLNGADFDFANTAITEDIELTAYFEELETYYVTFNVNGNETQVEVKEGKTVEMPSDPVVDGYEFAGWYLDNETFENEFDPATVIESSFTVYAKMVEDDVKYTVTFMVDGVQYGEVQTISVGGYATEPTAPTKDGYNFLGWYNGETKWDFEKDAVNDNVVLMAEWEEDKPAGIIEVAGGTTDFDSYSKNVTSYTNTTTGAGWVITNAQFTNTQTITSGARAAILNGPTTGYGTIKSPTLTTGLYKLTFNYGYAFSESKAPKVKITITYNGGQTLTKEFNFDKPTQNTACEASWDLSETPILGDFTILIENLSGGGARKTRLVIWNIAWTGAQQG